MTDADKAALEARERALRAQERARAAQARADELRRQSARGVRPHPESAERARDKALESEDAAKRSARTTHGQAADLAEERAGDLAQSGDEAGAERARAHADKARQRENET